VKSDAERGPIGAWAYRERRRKGWTVEEAVLQLEAKTGARLKAVSLRGIEAGPKPPSSEVRHALEEIYGSRAPDPQPITTLADLVVALAAQTAALNALVEELRAGRSTQPDESAVGAMAEALLRAGIRVDGPQLSPAGKQP
jgi:hypothetical protein